MTLREVDNAFVRRHTHYGLILGLVVGHDVCPASTPRVSLAAGRELADFDDAYPPSGPQPVDALRDLIRGTIVPGHRNAVDAAFVAARRDQLHSVARLDREATVAAATTWPRLAR